MTNSKEEKNAPHELSAEELNNVTGGFYREPRPADFVKCLIMASVDNPFRESTQGAFCQSRCEYHGTSNCIDCYHSPSISGAALRQKYEAFAKEWNKLNGIQ